MNRGEKSRDINSPKLSSVIRLAALDQPRFVATPPFRFGYRCSRELGVELGYCGFYRWHVVVAGHGDSMLAVPTTK